MSITLLLMCKRCSLGVSGIHKMSEASLRLEKGVWGAGVGGREREKEGGRQRERQRQRQRERDFIKHREGLLHICFFTNSVSNDILVSRIQ